VRKSIKIRQPESTYPESMSGNSDSAMGGDSGSRSPIKKPYVRPGSAPGASPAAVKIEREAHRKHEQKSGAADKGKARLRGVK
jgi:hypothetical protein